MELTVKVFTIYTVLRRRIFIKLSMHRAKRPQKHLDGGISNDSKPNEFFVRNRPNSECTLMCRDPGRWTIQPHANIPGVFFHQRYKQHLMTIARHMHMHVR